MSEAMSMLSYEQSACRAKAKRMADERGVTDHDEFLRLEAYVTHQEFGRAIEPIKKEIAKLYGYRFLKSIRLGASEAETEWEWLSPEAPKAIAMLQELIAAEAVKYGYRRPEQKEGSRG